MTEQTASSSSMTGLSRNLAILVIILIGVLVAVAYAYNQARQATTRAELAQATAEAGRTAAEAGQATAEAGRNAAVATARAEVVAARASVETAQATAAARLAEAEASLTEAEAVAAGTADTQARLAEAQRLAAAALAGLPGDPPTSLLLATQAVSASLAAGEAAPPEIVGALRQAVRANRLAGRLAAGHTGPVNGLAFSPDGNRLATAGDDGTVRIWDAASGGELLVLSSAGGPGSHAGPVYSVAFSPAGDRLATASFDKTAKIWDAKTGEELLTLAVHKDWVVGVAFSPAEDGPMLATGSQDGTAILWDTASGEARLTLTGHTAAVNRLAFNPKGDRLATASDDGTIILWDTTSGEAIQTFEGHEGPVYGVAFNPKGDRLASASVDGTVKLWDSNSGREVRSLRHGRSGWATAVAFNSTGAWLASAGEDGRVVLWDTATGRERLGLAGHTGAVNGLAIAAPARGGGGERLASASADGLVRLWQINDDEASPALPPLTGHRGAIYSLAVSPSGSRLATAGADGTIKIWQVDPAKNRLVRTLGPAGAAGALYAAAFSPDGNSLAAAGEDGTVTVWQTTGPAGGESNAPLSLAGHTAPIYALAFRPGSNQLASAGADGTARIWDVASGESLAVLAPPAAETAEGSGPVYGLAFNPAGTFLATAGGDGQVKIWDVASGEQVAFLPGTGVPVRALAFGPASAAPPAEANPDDLLAVGGDDGTVRLWQPDRPPRALPGAGAAIQGLAFSPDVTRLAATAADGTVTIWSMVSGQPLFRLASPAGERAGFGLAFLHAGAGVVAGSQAGPDGRGVALRWDVAADELLNLYSPASVRSLALAAAPAGSAGDRLAVAGADGVARLWQVTPGTGRWSGAPAGLFLTGEKAVLTSVAVGGDYLAAGGDAGSVWLWGAGSGKLLASLAAHTGPVNSLLLLPPAAGSGDTLLVSASQDDTVKVWPISPAGTVDDRPQLTLRGHTGDVVAMAFSPAARAEAGAGLLATASHDGTARLWSLEPGRELHRLPATAGSGGHTGWLHDLAFTASGDRLATAGEDGAVRLWDVASGRELLRLAPAVAGPIRRVAFAPGGADGERLAALAGDGTILVWSLAAGPNDRTPSLLLRLPPAAGERPTGLAFDPSGRALVTAGDDGVVRFYALDVAELLSLR